MEARRKAGGRTHRLLRRQRRDGCRQTGPLQPASPTARTKSRESGYVLFVIVRSLPPEKREWTAKTSNAAISAYQVQGIAGLHRAWHRIGTWVTDPLPVDGRGAGGNVGQQVTKLNRKGEVLLKLGQALVTGKGTNTFSSPSDVVVGRNGDIFVADGHATGTNERIMKFDRNGRYLKEWGSPGFGPCGTNQFSTTHALEIDSQGRLFVGDRDNNRIQIFDQDGNFLECWYQFGRPSGIHIDADDNIYVADSESRTDDSDYGGPPSPFKRGIRVGSARDGSVKYLIPDPKPAGGTSAAEGVAATSDGTIFGAEVGPRQVIRYQKK